MLRIHQPIIHNGTHLLLHATMQVAVLLLLPSFIASSSIFVDDGDELFPFSFSFSLFLYPPSLLSFFIFQSSPYCFIVIITPSSTVRFNSHLPAGPQSYTLQFIYDADSRLEHQQYRHCRPDLLRFFSLELQRKRPPLKATSGFN